MQFRLLSTLVLLGLTLLLTLHPPLALAQDDDANEEAQAATPTLLTDPFLQLPTEDGVHVVWFTEFAGSDHVVTFGETLDRTVTAETLKMSRTAEDEQSFVGEPMENEAGERVPAYEEFTPRDVWRHEAMVGGLTAGERVPYFITSVADDGTEITSEEFTLQPLPQPGQPLKILLTSDHQLKEMTPANLQMVEQTVEQAGGRVDAVFFAGDLVNIPDRASEWFDDNRGFAFFSGLQGNASYALERTAERDDITYTTERTYTGGEIIQHAPLFPATGNHEVMGRYIPGNNLGTQYNDPQPRDVAAARYEQIADLVNPDGDEAIREQWIRDNSYNTITYEELFTLPGDSPGGETYYAMQYGDVYLIGLYATRIWRTPSLNDDARGKYREPESTLNQPDNWGYGDFLFEDLGVDSEQHAWLVEQMESEAFQNSPYKVVLMHQAAHGVGDNYNPVFVDPVQIIDRDENGRISAVRYEYPIEDDIIINDIQPLFEQHGIDLVHSGHSHVWFRMAQAGVNYMETSNVGNNYGCYIEGYAERGNVPNDERYAAANYVATGDPHGLEPIMPTEFAPMQDEAGNELPCIASNDMTAFTIFDTADGTLSSYVFDVTDPQSEPQLFDQFSLNEE